MEAKTVLDLVEAADSMRSTLQGYLDELAELSPSQLEFRLGVSMKDTRPGERLEALLKHLDAQPANLRLQVRREHGNLVFGSFWLAGVNRLFSFECPASIAHYLDAPITKQVCTNFSREQSAALALLAYLLKVEPNEVLSQELIYALGRHHGLIEAMIGDPSARQRHSQQLADLAKKGIFWQDVLKATQLGREEVASMRSSDILELQPIEG